MKRHMPKRTIPLKNEFRKISKNIRMRPDDVRRLRLAADHFGMTETSYVTLALLEKFKRDGID